MAKVSSPHSFPLDFPFLQQDFWSSAQCLAMDLCIIFYQLLDEGFLMTIRLVTNPIQETDSSVCLSTIARNLGWGHPCRYASINILSHLFKRYRLVARVTKPNLFCICCWLQETNLIFKDRWHLRVKGWKMYSKKIEYGNNQTLLF